MSFARIMALASRIIRQVLRDRRTLALIFVVPILIMTLLYFVLTSTSSIHTLALVRPTGSGSDRVNTLIDKLLPGQDKLKTININADQVDKALKNGDADAAIIFPADFARQVFAGQNPAVQIKLEGSDPNVASAMNDIATGLTRQLGIALATLKAQQAGTDQGGQIPFTLSPGRDTNCAIHSPGLWNTGFLIWRFLASCAIAESLATRLLHLAADLCQ